MERLSKMASSPEISVRVHEVKGLHTDVLRKYPKGGRLKLSARVGSMIQSTHAVAWGSGVKMNQVTYTSSTGTISWKIASSLLQEVKASQPRVKFILHSAAHNSEEFDNVGFIVVDMRDLSRGVTESWFKVHGMGAGAEVQITAKINTLLQSIDLGPGPMNIAASMTSLASIGSTSSALRIEGDRNSLLPKYDISIGLEDFKGLAALCQAAAAVPPSSSTSASDSPPPADAGEKFWLCWTLFDQTIQTSNFQKHEAGPERVMDTIRVQCGHEGLLHSLAESFPLRVYVCTPGRIVAAAEVPLNIASLNHLPMKSSSWYDFYVPTQSISHTIAGAQIRASISIALASPGQEPEPEHEPEPEPTVAPVEAPRAKSPPLPAPEKAPYVNKKVAWDANSRVAHFRLSVDVRSVSGLKRAANYSIQYSYPHLGSAQPIRTSPMWLTANSEGKVSGGTATFECAMPRSVFLTTLQRYPLVLKATSRSHLGTEELGANTIDLGAILNEMPHSYRCPLTGRIFHSPAEFSRHRDALVALRETGKVGQSPPDEPVIVWTLDTVMEMMADVGNGRTEVEGGEVRVVVIIEDMGGVGTNIAQKVKPGYKMQGGAFYDEAGSGMEEHTGSGGADGNGGGADAGYQPPSGMPSGRSGGAAAKQEMERLRLDWEAWRRDAESAWREDLRAREVTIKRRLEEEATHSLAERADDLRKAQEEAARLEGRLRTALEAVEKQKSQLSVKEEQLIMKLSQKTAELQLLQRRTRDEAKAKVETSVSRLELQVQQNQAMSRQLERAEKRAKDAEHDYEVYRNHMRATPEAVLREEVARLKAVLAETRSVVERERRRHSEADLEKEHFRAQMHRLALALKRERERSSALARQELEQLRLEFLAREERYVLDGDRDELRNIRSEIGELRKAAERRKDQLMTSPTSVANTTRNATLARLQKERIDLIATGLYDEKGSQVIKEIDSAIKAQEDLNE